MLYDPKWNKTDPLSIHSLVAWLETKPADEVYWLVNAKTCLLGQYYKEKDFQDYASRSANTACYSKFGKVAISFDYALPYSTYGDALERARKIATTS